MNSRVKLILGHEAVLGDLVAVRLDLHVGLVEQDVVHLVLAPHAVARVVVVHARHECE